MEEISQNHLSEIFYILDKIHDMAERRSFRENVLCIKQLSYNKELFPEKLSPQEGLLDLDWIKENLNGFDYSEEMNPVYLIAVDAQIHKGISYSESELSKYLLKITVGNWSDFKKFYEKIKSLIIKTDEFKKEEENQEKKQEKKTTICLNDEGFFKKEDLNCFLRYKQIKGSVNLPRTKAINFLCAKTKATPTMKLVEESGFSSNKSLKRSLLCFDECFLAKFSFNLIIFDEKNGTFKLNREKFNLENKL